jgi:sugar phosphate permease
MMSVGYTGSGHSVVTTSLVPWFNLKTLGIVTGIAISGYSLSGFLIPLLNETINWFGWRGSFIALGLSTILVTVIGSLAAWKRSPDALIAVNREPERVMNTDNHARKSNEQDAKPGIRDVLKTRVFWVTALVMAIQYMAFYSASIHIMPFAVDIKLSAADASLLAMTLSITSVAGRLGGGWLSSIISPWRMFMIGLAIQILAFFLIYAYPQEWSIWTFVVMIGPVYGSSLILRSIIIRKYFHPGVFGTVQGLLWAL